MPPKDAKGAEVLQKATNDAKIGQSLGTTTPAKNPVTGVATASPSKSMNPQG